MMMLWEVARHLPTERSRLLEARGLRIVQSEKDGLVLVEWRVP